MSTDPTPDLGWFATERERLLWRATAFAVLGVYSTLVFGSALAELLYHQGIVTILYLAGVLLIGVAVLTQGLRVRPLGVEIGVALGILVVYAMIFLRLAIPERSHVIEYGVVAILLFEALREGVSAGRKIPVPGILAIVGTASIGALDETIQIFLPHRVFDPTDMLFNLLAATMAVVPMALLAWIRRVVDRRLERAGVAQEPPDRPGSSP